MVYARPALIVAPALSKYVRLVRCTLCLVRVCIYAGRTDNTPVPDRVGTRLTDQTTDNEIRSPREAPWRLTTITMPSLKSFAARSRAIRSMKTATHWRFLDIMPRSPGHTLVIPKAAARGILDIAADDFAEVARTAKKIAVAAVKAFGAEGIIVQQFSEAASGQVVFHLHMHVMPMTTGVDLLPPQTRKEDAKILQDHAAMMIAALED